MDERREVYTKYVNTYETRFSDFNQRRTLRGNACLSFFESARFDITRMTGFVEKLMQLLEVEQVILPVVEVKMNIKKQVRITDRVKIVTFLKDVTVPMFIFRHVLVDQVTGEGYMCADLKVAIVVPEQGTIRSFDKQIKQKVNEIIHSKGEVTQLISNQ